MINVILQSYRTKDVPTWILFCMDSVKSWAKDRGYEYEFIDDSLFDLIPHEINRRIRNDVPFICKTDLARLYWIESHIADNIGSEEPVMVTWIDADVAIFNPDKFVLSVPYANNFTVAQEAWYHRTVFGMPLFTHKVNNAVMSFMNMKPLRTYLRMAEYIITNTKKPNPLMLGPELLSSLYQNTKAMDIQRHVGNFGDAVIKDLKRYPNDIARKMTKAHGTSLYAANMTNSCKHNDKDMLGVVMLLRDIADEFVIDDKELTDVRIGDSKPLQFFKSIRKIKNGLVYGS